MKKKIISGIMVTIFLVTMVTFAFPVQVSAQFDDEIEIGIIGPKGWIQWDGIIEGAELARDIINHPGSFGLPGWGPENQGGMYNPGDGKYYELKLVEIDEHAVPVADPTAAVGDLLTALEDNTNMKILIGGFQGETCFPMREAAMDYAAVNGRPIWIICGAADDYLIDDGPDRDNPYDDVREDYERYKYMFRSDPMNSTALGNQLFFMAAQLQIPKLKALFGIDLETGLLPTYFIGEDLKWCDEIVDLVLDYAADLGITIVGVGRPSAIETDFAPFLDAIEDSGAKLILDIFSNPAGAAFIKQWGERKIPVVPIGINVESQMGEFYSSIGGKCEYETLMSALGTRTNINPDAEPLSTTEFWDLYRTKYGHDPIYNSWGVYIELIYLNRTAAEWIGKPCDEIIPMMEQHEEETLLGHFKYTKYHDIYCDDFSMTPLWPSYDAPPHHPGVPGTVRAHIPQWQAGRLEVVWPRGYWCATDEKGCPLPDTTPLPFARKWKIPSWIYSLGETDFAGGPDIPSPHIDVDGTPAGFFGSFTSPNGDVGPADMGAVTGMWQQTCAWTLLEADMDGNNFIDIDDVARVALDWGKTATPQDP